VAAKSKGTLAELADEAVGVPLVTVEALLVDATVVGRVVAEAVAGVVAVPVAGTVAVPVGTEEESVSVASVSVSVSVAVPVAVEVPVPKSITSLIYRPAWHR
jgi:hypothetical protein